MQLLVKIAFACCLVAVVQPRKLKTATSICQPAGRCPRGYRFAALVPDEQGNCDNVASRRGFYKALRRSYDLCEDGEPIQMKLCGVCVKRSYYSMTVKPAPEPAGMCDVTCGDDDKAMCTCPQPE